MGGYEPSRHFPLTAVVAVLLLFVAVVALGGCGGAGGGSLAGSDGGSIGIALSMAGSSGRAARSAIPDGDISVTLESESGYSQRQGTRIVNGHGTLTFSDVPVGYKATASATLIADGTTYTGSGSALVQGSGTTIAVTLMPVLLTLDDITASDFSFQYVASSPTPQDDNTTITVTASERVRRLLSQSGYSLNWEDLKVTLGTGSPVTINSSGILTLDSAGQASQLIRNDLRWSSAKNFRILKGSTGGVTYVEFINFFIKDESTGAIKYIIGG